MKNKELIRSVKFVLFSAGAGIIQIGTFTLFNEAFRMPYWPAYLISLLLSVLFNFTVNRAYTFKSTANVPAAMLKVLLFYCAFTPLSTWGGDYLTTALLWNEYLVLAVTMILNFVLEFLYCRFFVYRGNIDNNARAKKQEAE